MGLTEKQYNEMNLDNNTVDEEDEDEEDDDESEKEKE